MALDDRLDRLVRTVARRAGQEFAEARRAYREGRAGIESDGDDIRIVCRRHAERRTVRTDSEGRPDCFESDHPDCEGCAEDVRAGAVETW